MKYLFIILNVQDGEHRHTHRVLHTSNGTDIDFIAQWYAADYYGTEVERNNEWWNFDNGCIAVEVTGVRELSEFEYKLMSDMFSNSYSPKPYFEIVHSGYQRDLQREEIQIHAGENGNIFLIKNDLGIIVDIYGQNDLVDTLSIFEDEFDPEDDEDNDNEEVKLPDNVNEFDVKEYKREWGQNHVEICNNLGYPSKHSQADDLLMVDYFYLETEKQWYPIISSMYSEKEQLIADYLRLNRNN